MPSPRVLALRVLPAAANPPNERSFRHALVACLSAEEACEALDSTFGEPYSSRRTVLNKIIKDLQVAALPCHQTLVNQLIAGFSHLAYKRRQSCANALIHLTEAVPDLGRTRVLQLLLSSKYVSLRRQAYASLRRRPDDTTEAKLPDAWDTWKDPESLALIVDRMPIEWLLPRMEDFLGDIQDGRLLSRLFVRLGKADLGHLELLYEVNPVSYAFAASKLHYPVPESRMRGIFERAWHSEHQSLVIWCIGQLGYWDTLMELYNDPGPPFEFPGVIFAGGEESSPTEVSRARPEGLQLMRGP